MCYLLIKCCDADKVICGPQFEWLRWAVSWSITEKQTLIHVIISVYINTYLMLPDFCLSVQSDINSGVSKVDCCGWCCCWWCSPVSSTFMDSELLPKDHWVSEHCHKSCTLQQIRTHAGCCILGLEKERKRERKKSKTFSLVCFLKKESGWA